MKKVYDWDISINIYVESCKKKFSMICSVHTNIHELALQVATMLEMDSFETKIDFYFRGSNALRPISTLLQNQVKDKDTLIAKVLTTKKINYLQMEEEDKKMLKKGKDSRKNQCFGMTLTCTCVEPRCINYGKDVLVPIGSGEFKFSQLINSNKCEFCPYRDQMINPAMIVKAIELNRCLWKMEGTHMYKGFPTHLVEPFKRVIEKHNLYDFLRKYKWQNDLVLTIKDL